MDDCFGVKYVQIKNKLVPIMCFQRHHTLGLDLKPRKILRKIPYLILTTNFKKNQSSSWFWILTPIGKITEVATKKCPNVAKPFFSPCLHQIVGLDAIGHFYWPINHKKVVDYGILFAWLICQVDVFCLPCGWNFLLRHLVPVITSNYVPPW
jgi:hypothetical protein